MEGKKKEKMEKTIARLTIELASEKEKRQLEKKENKLLKSQIKSVEKKLCSSKKQTVSLKQELGKELKKTKLIGISSQQSIDRHKYTDFVVLLCVEIYMRCGCGFRKSSDLFGYLNELMGWGFKDIPCANSIENWVKKSGFNIYHSPEKPETSKTKAYAEIIDESMMLGSEKMLLTLGIDAEKETEGALSRRDISVLNISVASGWNSASIKEEMEETEKKMGQAPLYVVSDNDSKLNKAIKEKSYIHIRDIGHTMALLIERVYKEAKDFKEYTSCLSAVKVREVMRATSYLLPPCQRTIARFMNLSGIIKWSQRIRKVYSSLTKQEQETFAFTRTYSMLVDELDCIFGFVNESLKLIKTEGLSIKNINLCLENMNKQLQNKGARIDQVCQSIKCYLLEEQSKLTDEKTVWHASSDIIESVFGFYKFRKSKNQLNGITPYVLVLPLLTKIGEGRKPSSIDFKSCLENVFMKNIVTWKTNNLTENLAVKRKLKLVS
jgi:hypothetical protein